ncbi:hypothetical protein TNCV_129411 [Trichonephila clavipes]|nr:hypothetical protein TNCV_129411 [Trichonephila clavipes]
MSASSPNPLTPTTFGPRQGCRSPWETSLESAALKQHNCPLITDFRTLNQFEIWIKSELVSFSKHLHNSKLEWRDLFRYNKKETFVVLPVLTGNELEIDFKDPHSHEL